MTDDPDEQRIREKAYHLWVSQGRPHGRADAHWDMARELVAIEDSQLSTLRKPPAEGGEPVEPAIAFENQGEFPTLTDEGEAASGPTRQMEAANADERPQTPPRKRAAAKGVAKADAAPAAGKKGDAKAGAEGGAKGESKAGTKRK